MPSNIEVIDFSHGSTGRRTHQPPNREDLLAFLIIRPSLADELIADLFVERRRKRQAMKRIGKRCAPTM